MSNSLSELVHNTSEFFKSEECKSCIEKTKINSEFCFVRLKNKRLICKCKKKKKCKKECKRPIEKLTKMFLGIYQFCNSDVNKSFLLLRKSVNPYQYMDTSGKLDQNTLLRKKDFYSNLNLEDINDEDYTHAQKYGIHLK